MAPFPVYALEISNNTTLLLFLIIQSIYTLILCPITIFYAHKLWKLHQEKVLFISKRRPQNVIFGILLLNFYSMVVRPLTDIPRIWIPAQQYDNSYLRMALINVIVLFFYGLFARAWLLYYDYKRCVQSLSIQWKQHILKQESYTPWTLQYKLLGNTRIIFIITIIFWIISMFIIQFGTLLFGQHYGNGSQTVTTIPAILGSIIISFKIRKWNDMIYLKRELQLCAFVLLLAVFIFTVFVIPFLDSLWNIRLIITNIITAGLCYSLAFISTQWVMSRYNKQCDVTPSDKQLSLEDILSTKTGFRLYANYLVKEFSIEHLLFLFEIISLKNELIATEIINRNDAGIMITMKYMDKSSVNNKDIEPKTIKEIKATLKYIICQYIDAESEHSVNISARIRRNILKLSLDEERVSDITISMEEIPPHYHTKLHFGSKIHSNSSILQDFDIIVCLKKFDGAIEEVIKLLTCDSLIRFYQSYEYQQMIKDIKDNGNNKEKTNLV